MGTTYKCQPVRKRDTPIARKGPELARACGDFTDAAGGNSDDDDCDHDVGCGVALGRIIKNLDKGVAGFGFEDLGHVAETVAHCNCHDKAHGSVEIDRPHD